MISPRTYYGYNSENECIHSVTAENANNYIDPAEVQAAIDKFKTTVSDELGKVSKALSNITQEASEAVIVQGTKMDKVIEETATALGTIGESMGSSVESIYSEAVKAHDTIQEQLNANAKAAAGSGAAYVKG